MVDDYATISVRREAFEELSDAKPQGVTWSRWLKDNCINGGSDDE